jgi:hypothetical protein
MKRPRRGCLGPTRPPAARAGFLLGGRPAGLEEATPAEGEALPAGGRPRVKAAPPAPRVRRNLRGRPSQALAGGPCHLVRDTWRIALAHEGRHGHRGLPRLRPSPRRAILSAIGFLQCSRPRPAPQRRGFFLAPAGLASGPFAAELCRIPDSSSTGLAGLGIEAANHPRGGKRFRPDRSPKSVTGV